MAQPPKQLQGSSTRFRGSDRGWPAQRCGARCWPQPRTGRLTRCAHGHSHGEAESGMHGHTRPAGQQKPSPPVTARPILSIHPNRLGPSGLDRAIADRHARRGDANSHSPEGANVRFCVCWSTEIGGQVEGTIAVPGGRVWFQRIGGGPGRPLLVVHGGPGLPHNYLAPLRRLSDEREVIFWDQLGCGNSACPSDVDLWTMNRSVAEMATVAEALALTRFEPPR